MKKLFLIASIVCFAAGIAHAQEAPFALKIWADKEAYQAGDEIEFTLQLWNESSQSQYVYVYDLYPAQLFQIADQDAALQAHKLTAMYDVVSSLDNYKLVWPGNSYTWKVKAKIVAAKEYTGKLAELDKCEAVLDFGDSLILIKSWGLYKVFVAYKGVVEWFASDDSGKPVSVREALGDRIFSGVVDSNTIKLSIANRAVQKAQ